MLSFAPPDDRALGRSSSVTRANPTTAALRAQLGRWAHWLSALLIGSTLVGVWLVSGVPSGDIARFAAYEACYVVFPGCLLYALLNRVPGGRLLALALGWPLGYALEIGAFALTALLHARGAFTFLPLIAAVTIGPCLLYKRQRRLQSPALPGDGRPRGPRQLRIELLNGSATGAESLLAAGAIAIALLLMAFRFFATYPLPEHASSVFYFLDNVEYIALAAEALHHWPIMEPFLAGHPFRYYTGVFIHFAAIKQVTGVPLAVLVFRLIPATAVLVATLQFWCLGGLLHRSRWAGPVTVALLIVIENMKLYPTHTKVLGVALFSEFAWSPTYGFGVIFLLGILILFGSHLLASGSRGALVMLGVLVLGTGAVKTTALAGFLGGLGIFWLWRLLTAKLDRSLSYALMVSFAGLIAMYVLLLAGSSGPAATYTTFAPLDFLKYTVFGATLAAHPGAAPLIGAATVMFVWKLLPAVGSVWPLHKRGAWSSYASLAVGLFAVGFVVYVLLGSPAGNESYFIWYGYIALIPLATASLIVLWRDVATDGRRALVRACAAALAVGLVIAGATQILTAGGAPLAGPHGPSWYLWYAATVALVAVFVAYRSLRLQRRLAQRLSSRAARVAACAVVMLGALGCAESLVLAAPATWNTLLDRRTVPRNSPSHPGMTAALYQGLVWVRTHTGTCNILAANTHELPGTGAAAATPDPGYFYYSAFSERRVLLESWIVTVQGQHGEQPYPALYALNSEATVHGSASAIRALAHKGVSYILIDRSHGGDVREPTSVSRLVFSNSALDVYRVTAPVGPHGC